MEYLILVGGAFSLLLIRKYSQVTVEKHPAFQDVSEILIPVLSKSLSFEEVSRAKLEKFPDEKPGKFQEKPEVLYKKIFFSGIGLFLALIFFFLSR